MNQYGLHSPFLYDVYLECFRPRFSNHFPKINALRKSLSNDDSTISITDFGAGSLVNSKKERKVAEMFSSASVSGKQGELLNRLSSYFKPRRVLELGTHLGLSSAYLCHSGIASFISLEGCPETALCARENHKRLGIHEIDMTVGEFTKTLPLALEKLKEVDLAYIDGNHSYDGTLWNFEQILPFTSEESVLIFDDINWSPDMKRAWEEIISRSEISLSVNCYKFGLVFFRSGVEKQDFYFKL